MKRLTATLFFLATIASLATAQSRINAADIIAQINRGEAVQYDNVEIEGVLDLTHLDNQRRTESSDGWFGFGGSNDTYESHVEVPLSFTNCTFRDDVLAYYHHDGEDETFIAHFDERVQFSGCTFTDASEFKYSEFAEIADFRGAAFADEANFKYANFPAGASFESAVFNDLANFKYSKFEEPINLNNVSFNGDEDFKYTEVDGEDFTTFLLKNQPSRSN